jgi:soluble lytic murein transglycosylase-like protein
MSSKMRIGFAALLIATTLTSPSVASAQNGGAMAAHYGNGLNGNGLNAKSAVPAVLSQAEREHFRALFQAIDRQQWQQVEQMLNEYRDSALYQVALAEYFTHANSPTVSGDRIANWFTMGAHLPQATKLAKMGQGRGVSNIPSLPRTQGFQRQPYAPKRIRPRSVSDGTMPGSTKSAILDRIKNDDPAGAYALLQGVDDRLSAEARAEWRQRVAWSFYIENDDANALALAEKVSEGGGAWVAEGDWVAGLAAWRQGFCALAGESFARAAQQSTNDELTSAAHYWAHRSLIRCREPEQAQEHLRAATRYHETLYGMLALDQLGMDLPAEATAQRLSADDWRTLGNVPNARVAAALVEIGRTSLADEVLRYQAQVGEASEFPALSRLARELGLPATQLFMAQNAPYGMQSETSLRYPVASWKPVTGWRVDPALAFAHALQESNFRASAVSPANARGLMQIMPGTASDHNRRLNLGASYSDLNDPEVNLAYGQQHLELLRDSPATGGLLPKIMAAYNAGLSPVSRWNTEVNDQGDALLWMESIPYWETRGYVAIVMRNYWMYERAAGITDSPSRHALAQGQWPVFPQMATQRTASVGE